MAALLLHLQVKPGVVPVPAEVLPGSGVQPIQVWYQELQQRLPV